MKEVVIDVEVKYLKMGVVLSVAFNDETIYSSNYINSQWKTIGILVYMVYYAYN